jgi:IS605 OrfB family transposase
MIRAVKLSLGAASAVKQRQIQGLKQRQVACINRFLRHIWHNGGKLDGPTLKAIPEARLSQRYKSSALNQALGIISATRASAKATGKTPTCPEFKGTVQLSSMVAKVTPSTSSTFSYWIKLSTLTPGSPILIPVKGSKMLDKWLAQPGATLKPSIGLGDRFVTFYVDVPTLPPKAGRALAVDVGLNKMLVDSDGKHYGADFKAVVAKVTRRIPGSAGKKAARTARDQYINQVVNTLPWNELSTIVVEKLKNLKQGKKPSRSRNFRRVMAPWTYAYVLDRIRMKAEENRVLVVETSPAYTSQTCPSCKHVARSNRANEKFCCVRCGFTADADVVGAHNILARYTTRSPESLATATAAKPEAKTSNF